MLVVTLITPCVSVDFGVIWKNIKGAFHFSSEKTQMSEPLLPATSKTEIDQELPILNMGLGNVYAYYFLVAQNSTFAIVFITLNNF